MGCCCSWRRSNRIPLWWPILAVVVELALLASVFTYFELRRRRQTPSSSAAVRFCCPNPRVASIWWCLWPVRYQPANSSNVYMYGPDDLVSCDSSLAALTTGTGPADSQAANIVGSATGANSSGSSSYSLRTSLRRPGSIGIEPDFNDRLELRKTRLTKSNNLVSKTHASVASLASALSEARPEGRVDGSNTGEHLEMSKEQADSLSSKAISTGFYNKGLLLTRPGDPMLNVPNLIPTRLHPDDLAVEAMVARDGKSLYLRYLI
ncbi:unnamed protein product [Protopolystoma xenopodis]|uniref:Uncharacterized protein n=1 Tax=Protopolystoma xenopodis TaxID=117903 RepID=A0A3S5CD80_9PLAT|nr:unnamed protein product [Protopolystoma xenopodis]